MSSPAAPSTPAAARSSSVSSAAVRSTQWDRCLENGAIKTAYGVGLAAAASVVLFRSGGARLALTGFGAGVGAGNAWYECKQAYAPSRFQNSLLSPAQNAAAATLPRCGRASCKCGANCKCMPVGFASVQNGVLPTFKVEQQKEEGCCK